MRIKSAANDRVAGGVDEMYCSGEERTAMMKDSGECLDVSRGGSVSLDSPRQL